MKIYRGKSVFDGIAIGKLLIYTKNELSVVREELSDVEKEVHRFEDACRAVITQLQTLQEKAAGEVGEAYAAIFEVHQMILSDESYTESVKKIIIEQQVNAEYAVDMTAEHFVSIFQAMDDEYMKSRAADVKDVSERILLFLRGSEKDELHSEAPFILVAEDLTPSETLQLDKDKLLAFVTIRGGVHSHTAILAKTMNLPALVGTDFALSKELNGQDAIVDGFEGVLYIEPDEETRTRLEQKREQEKEHKKLLLALKGKEDRTRDGRRMHVYANIGEPADLHAVIENDAGGIGLFRSEFLYLESDHFPSEEEQFESYRAVAEAMGGKRVIIRTMDIGADKQTDYFDLEQEENPALGYRAIRICLSRTDIFKTQLRAILRAGAYGNIEVMYPMITSVGEVRRIKAIMEEVKQELTAEGIVYGKVAQGVMIETPAAVMVSEELAREVDFFSIGTNDLTQYTLAIDRQNPRLDEFYDAHHPAILRMIRMTVENGHKAGISVGICGELGADTALTREFLEMGVDELSVSPSSILPIRKIIREI